MKTCNKDHKITNGYKQNERNKKMMEIIEMMKILEKKN